MSNYKTFTLVITILILLSVGILLVVESPYVIGFMMIVAPTLMLTYAFGILRANETNEKTLEDGWFEND